MSYFDVFYYSIMQNSIDDLDEDLSSRIREFLSQDTQFREADFDPAPYLIKILKEKEANQQLIVQKQTELILLENQAQDLIIQATRQYPQQFFEILDLPHKFGVQLERLKHGISSVKKKVKETKGLLLATQKDIMQIHLNCILNKLIYKKLKEVQLKLSQYQAASLALKNHLYLQCAVNLPTFPGSTVLENALTARTQNLKLRFLSQGIEEIRLFLYFTPRLTIQIKHNFMDASDLKENIFNEATHEHFYKRYLLFKKAKAQEYISSIWALDGLEARNGKVGIIDGIIKGIIRIGKVNEITDSLSLDCKKSINNIYSVLYYFFIKDWNQKNKEVSKKKRWFTSFEATQHTNFLSAVVCISAALIRKIIIVRRICSEYQLYDFCNQLASDRVLMMVKDELYNFISEGYFSQNNNQSQTHDPLQIIRKSSSFVLWPYFKRKIESYFIIMTSKLTTVQKEFFQLSFPDNRHFLSIFDNIQKKFGELFQIEFFKTFQTVFPEGRGLIPQNYDSILASKQHLENEIAFCTKYISQDKKSLRQFVNFVSFLTSMSHYYKSNDFSPQKLRTYSAFMLVFFYLKINSVIFRCLISPSAYDKCMDSRFKDSKVKSKQKHMQSQFLLLVAPRQRIKIDKRFKQIQNDSVPLRNAQQLRMIKTQVEMLLYYCLQNIQPLSAYLQNPVTDKMELQLDKHEPSNYDDNLPAKMQRVWQQLLKPAEKNESIEPLLAGLYRRLLDLYLTLTAGVYLQTGVF